MSAVITGLLAASAGVFTKAAGDADHLATYACSHHHLLPVDILCRHISESVMTVIIQVMLYGLMIGSNVAMFNCFNATLQRCDTTIVASVTCTAANITFSVRKYSIHSFMISILDSFPPSSGVLRTRCLWRSANLQMVCWSGSSSDGSFLAHE